MRREQIVQAVRDQVGAEYREGPTMVDRAVQTAQQSEELHVDTIAEPNVLMVSLVHQRAMKCKVADSRGSNAPPGRRPCGQKYGTGVHGSRRRS